MKYLQSEEPTLRYFILHEISKNINLLPYSIDDNNMLISFINCLLNIIINEVLYLIIRIIHNHVI